MMTKVSDIGCGEQMRQEGNTRRVVDSRVLSARILHRHINTLPTPRCSHSKSHRVSFSVNRFRHYTEPISFHSLNTFTIHHEVHAPLPRRAVWRSRSPSTRRRPRSLPNLRSPQRSLPRGLCPHEAPVQQQLLQSAHRWHCLPRDQLDLRTRNFPARQCWRRCRCRSVVLQPAC
jgi:hypothetical protein